MKRIIQQMFCLVLMVSGLGFHACRQGDEVDLNKMVERSGTRADGDIVCEIETKEPGKLDSLINVFVKDKGCARGSINILSLKGPLNPTDIGTICGFQYLDSLNMEKVTMVTAEGDTTTVFSGFGNFRNPNAAVVLPKMLAEIGENAFGDLYNQSFARTVILCEGVKKIGTNAFYRAEVRSVVCPESLVEIGRQAFCESKLEKISLAGKLSIVDEWAFGECESLTEISLADTNIKRLPKRMFYGCVKLSMVELPSTLLSIGEFAFEKCDELKKVNIPQSVEEMERGVFNLCCQLEHVVWPSKITDIPSHTFNECHRMKTEIPEGVVSIGECAFAGCLASESFTVPARVKSIGKSAFARQNVVSVKLEDGVALSKSMFDGCAKLESITLPADAVEIPESFLVRCKNLKVIDLPKSVTSIGRNAFEECSNLEEIKLNEGLRTIGFCAFKYCTNLKEIRMNEGLRTIESYAFEYCTNLKEIQMNEGLQTIESYAFEYCTNLKEIQMNEGLQTIEYGAFQYCTDLKEIQLNEGLQTIESYAFRNTALETLTIPSTVTDCNSGLVTGCPHITAVFWNSLAQAPDLIEDKERNLLVYLPAGGSSVKENHNQIVDGHALNIYLTEDGNFKCPKEFKADKIYFTKNFSWDWDSGNKPFTAPGKSAGWLTMALPFAVSKIYTEETDSRVLAPFNAGVADSKPFWLRELTSEGFKNVTKIEADKPYIVAMPYNDNYLPEYNIRCRVTFMGENVTIPVTANPVTVTGPEYDFTPTYSYLGKVADKLVTNKRFYNHTNGKNYEAGSVFLANEPEILAFDAYITAHKAGTRIIEIAPSAGTRGVKKVGKIPSIDDM